MSRSLYNANDVAIEDDLRIQTSISVTHITGRAPGKLVLSGDYIALFDAPALVLAVNRDASAKLTPKSTGGWSIRSNIAPRARFNSLTKLMATDEQPLLKTLIDALPTTLNLPSHAELSLDTSTFYEGNMKLGIGSSAAILVALAEVLGHITESRFKTRELIDLHNSLYGKNGSGVDIVAARLGGLTRFQNGAGNRVTPPPGLYMCFVFTGISTSTEPMLARFRKLVEERSKDEVTQWQKLATMVANSLNNAAVFLENLATLNQFVSEFDRTSQLGIYGSAHRKALEIANDVGVLYKPCGAGGGDTGVALTDDPDALGAFEQIAVSKNLTLLNLKMENHGATVQL